MIVVDVEASGVSNFYKSGVWQIGAVEFENPSNTFLQEARIDDEDNVEDEALKVTGKTKSELRDKNKQSQKKMLKDFFRWVSKIENKTFVSHNPFDYGILRMKAGKYGLTFPFEYRVLDIHSIAFAKFKDIKKKIPFENGKSAMNLSSIIKFCGLRDNRRLVEEGSILKEGNPHNGLEDAKLEAECLSRILYGKGLFDKFKEFEVPGYLKKK